MRRKVEEAIAQHGSLKKALELGIWMNEEKQIPIKKVRVLTGLRNPINIRQQRDKSRHEYKQQFHVQNDRNYILAIYSGTNAKGKEQRAFELISNLAAARFYRRSNENNKNILPASKNGLKLSYKLKIGLMVILYENDPNEIWSLNKNENQKRLYIITRLGINSPTAMLITLVHHQEARPSSEIKLKNGAFKASEEFRPGIKMLHTQFRALVAGEDFEINDLGEITRLK